MRAAGYHGILARPGYNKKYNRDVSWQELKNTFTLYKRIPMIVAGGDHHGRIDPNTAVGFVDAKIDEDAQVIRMDEPVFYEEKFESVPAEIQRRLLYHEFIPASLGYEPFGDMRKIDHLLIGAKDPVFPDVGIHAEEGFYYEETEGMSSDKKQEEKPDAPVQYVTKEDFDKFSSQVLEALKARETPHEEPSEETVSEAATLEEPQAEPTVERGEEETIPPPHTPKVEPERVIPKSSGSKSSGDWLEDEDGHRYLSFRVAGTEETKK